MNIENINEKDRQAIKNSFEKKLKDVKCVDEIESILNVRISSSSINSDLKNLYKKLYQSKKLLQLLINSFNDFNGYKDYSYNLMVDETGGCKEWQSCCEYDDNRRLWKCVSRPSQEAIVDLIFYYLLYLASVRKKENNISSETGDVVKKIIDRCTFCDNEVNDGKCTVCDADCSEMTVTSDKTPMVHDDVRVETSRNVNNTNIPSSSNVRLDTNEYQGNQCYGKEVIHQAKVIPDKWICGKCECFNEYNLTNCMACGELLSEGFWHCEHCTMKNSGNVKICDTCHKSNDNVRVKDERHGNDGFYDNKHKEEELFNKLRKEELFEKLTKEEWQCGNCGNVYSYIDNVCRQCNGDRNNCGVWRCDICTCRNRFVNHNCVACGKINDKIDKKKFNNNNTNTGKKNDRSNINDGSGKWKCKNLSCGSMNDKNEAFCSGCKFDRNMSLIVGATIKKKTKTGIVEIWMCHKCNKLNDISNGSCKGVKCNVKKGELITCISCRATSDERRSNCDKCGKKF